MEVERKQLYLFIILTALSLKINASPVTEDEIDTSPMNTTLGSDREDSVNNSPNIEFTTRGVDVAKKNPFADDSHRPFPIFIYEDTTSCNNLLPFVDTKRILKCSSSFEERSYGSYKEYSESSSSSSIKTMSVGYTAPEVTLGISDPSGTASIEVTPVPNSVNVGMGNTDSTAEMAYFFNQEGGSVSRSRITCNIYDVTVNIDNPNLKLHSGFIADIKRIDLATHTEKKAVMQKFIDNYGTHYAKISEMGVGMEFETRYNQQETMDTESEDRNKCSSKTGGFSLMGVGASASTEECTAFSSASQNGASSHVKRMEHITYGVLPAEGGFANVGAWGNRVQEMWEAGTLSPIPIKQELEPIYKIFLTDTVKNIVHDDKITKINVENVISTAVKYYSEYCTLMGKCDYPACPTSVVLDGDVYHETVNAVQGRKIYEDYQNGNSLMYRELDYTNGWVVVPTKEPEKILKQTAPCPYTGGKFIPSNDVSKWSKPLPSENWKDCSIMCQNEHNCKFWQYNKIDLWKSCLLLEDYESIESSDATTDYITGSKDCPGDDKASQSSFGQCPNNIKAKSMWKIGDEKGFNKDLRIKSPVCPAGYNYQTDYFDGRCYETACPKDVVHVEKYHLVDGRCYYFEKFNTAYYGLAQRRCSEMRFPSHGRLFEPMSIEISDKVLIAAYLLRPNKYETDFEKFFRIGVKRDATVDSDFKFASSGVTVPYAMPWRFSENVPSTSDPAKQCVTANNKLLTWSDGTCADSRPYICESVGLTPSWA